MSKINIVEFILGLSTLIQNQVFKNKIKLGDSVGSVSFGNQWYFNDMGDDTARFRKGNFLLSPPTPCYWSCSGTMLLPFPKMGKKISKLK